MLRAKQMNLKPSLNLSLHAGYVLDAGSTGDTRGVFFWLEGFQIKASRISIITSKSAVHEC